MARGRTAKVLTTRFGTEGGRALVRIANEPGFADALRDAGEKRVGLYDYRRMARDYVAVYREVTGA